MIDPLWLKKIFGKIRIFPTLSCDFGDKNILLAALEFLPHDKHFSHIIVCSYLKFRAQRSEKGDQ